MTTVRDYKTPGVYLKELPAFPPSIVGVATAVPIFIGYTQRAVDPVSQKPVYMQAIELNSMADYYNYFGYGYYVRYGVEDGTATNFDFEAVKSDDTAGYFLVNNTETVHFNMFTAVKLFYANGGGKCYVISVANYQGTQTNTPTTDPGVKIDKKKLLDGLNVAQDKVGPTMTVVPDACLLESNTDYGEVASREVNQAGELQDRVAILDMWGAMDPAKWTKDGLKELRTAFYTAVSGAAANFSYGTAYAPALQTAVLGISDIDFTNLQANQADSDRLKDLLKKQVEILYPGDGNKDKRDEIDKKIDTAFPADLKKDPVPADQIQPLNQYLTNAVPLLLQVENILLNKLNAAPPSGVMSGIWTANDANRGVWNAPANMTCISVIAPEVLLTDTDQADYNVPLNGNAINILRAFTNRGTVVWGARTLDGNSNDYRYIQVRRTLVYIEQSIKTALQPFVFAANDGTTWVTVVGMISDFLTGLWTQGGLMGDKASDAFTVQCGLGSTMTGQDILNGYMVVAVTLQMIHPAEFIELTFTQKMQGV